MFRHLRRTVRRTRRLFRPAVALLLVVAQVATAFGFPVVARGGAKIGSCGGACGCDPASPSDGCHCGTGQCSVPLEEPTPPKPDLSCGKCGHPHGSCCCPEPEPEPEACPKCRAKHHATPITEKPIPVVRWVLGMKARECRGDGPLGLFADISAVPPLAPARPTVAPAPVGVVSLIDLSFTSCPSLPLEPPPRCS
ncbi:MAG TPA: hypothetical protein VKE74_01310 [Gemmataceae bacterium]|nr:hypothetical protein [Gemmataceae bacterium]